MKIVSSHLLRAVPAFRSCYKNRIVRTMAHLVGLQKHEIFRELCLREVSDLPKKNIVPLHSKQFKSSKGYTNDTSLKPVILLHGLFGSSKNFNSSGRKISEQTSRCTFGIDLRNHGKSEKAKPFNYLTMARDVISFLEERGLSEVILAGHSMGAKVSMLVSLLRPDLVSKLIVIDNSPSIQALDDSFQLELLAMCHVEREFMSFHHGSITSSRMDRIISRLSNYVNDSQVQFFLTSDIDRKLTRRKSIFVVPVLNFLKGDIMDQMGDWPEQEIRGKKFDGPVLVMAANHSNFINRENKCSFAKYFKSYSFINFDSSHWIVSEKPKEFVESVIKFINGY